jgi:hypothetical protein
MTGASLIDVDGDAGADPDRADLNIAIENLPAFGVGVFRSGLRGANSWQFIPHLPGERLRLLESALTIKLIRSNPSPRNVIPVKEL